MGREASSPATAANGVAGSSSSGQKRKAAVDDDGRGEDDNWLKLSLAPVDYGDPTGDVVDNNSSCAPAVMTSTEERSGTAAGVASGSARAGLIPNGAVPVFPCFNFLGTSMSSSSLSHLHQQSSSTRRQSNASTASSSGGIGGGDDDEAPNVMNGGDKNDGNALPDPPYPWATNEVAKHHSLVELARRDIININGEARCRRCDTRKMIVYNIATKFREVSDYFRQNYQHMNDRAQARWMNPVVPNCDNCGHERCMRPVIAAEKERINWLFLLLGETLGLCTLDQLKYFCAHTNRHRTGAKDRVLFSTYEELCNQLAPGLITGHDQLRMLDAGILIFLYYKRSMLSGVKNMKKKYNDPIFALNNYTPNERQSGSPQNLHVAAIKCASIDLDSILNGVPTGALQCARRRLRKTAAAVQGAGSSLSGQKRKAAMDDDGSSEDDN
uniref:DUF7086 domain-containing protein n=1 Tax=Oryza glumipatula TaxID=40148 RepID=A0A0E0A2D9_9ORYZ